MPTEDDDIQPVPSDQEKIETFLVEVVKLERRYAFELRNVTKERRGELMDLLNRFSARELEANELEENNA